MKHTLELRERGYDRIKHILTDSAKISRELVFLGRQMSIIRANNHATRDGFARSPSNRTAIMSRSAARQMEGSGLSGYWMFSLRLFVLGALFWAVNMRRRVKRFVGFDADNFEVRLEKRMSALYRKY